MLSLLYPSIYICVYHDRQLSLTTQPQFPALISCDGFDQLLKTCEEAPGAAAGADVPGSADQPLAVRIKLMKLQPLVVPVPPASEPPSPKLLPSCLCFLTIKLSSS